MNGSRDRGGGTIVVLSVTAVLVAVVTSAIVPTLDAMLDRRRAQTAADAAALAGVSGGQAASVALAESNGAELVAWTISGRQVAVTVAVDGQQASARATDGP